MQKHELNLLLVGVGNWGKNYISTLNDFTNINLQVANRYNWKQKINEHPDGVFVCTPPQSHIEIAHFALSKNIPTMIEKPLSLSFADACSLQEFKVPILVNHLHLFSTQYQQIKKIINKKDISWIFSQGSSLGPIRIYSSLWDYGPHDLSMILDLSNKFPKEINIKEMKKDKLSLYAIELLFDTFSSLSVIGNAGYNKKRLFNVYADLNLLYNGFNSISVKPLALAIKIFIDAIYGNYDYRLGLDLPLQVIKILETCSNQL